MMDKLKFNLILRFCFFEPHAGGSAGFVLKQDFLQAKFADLAATTLLSSRVNIRMPPQQCGSQLRLALKGRKEPAIGGTAPEPNRDWLSRSAGQGAHFDPF
jgi:hypothetical protein